MKIYVASSWRNLWQPKVVEFLRSLGHDVYDFRNPSADEDGFHWSEINGGWQKWSPEEYRTALRHPVAERGFRRDMDALEGCDACVLVQPCGTSSHVELGWAAGASKRTAVLFPFGFDTSPVEGHSGHHLIACNGCGDLDGCHLPARLHRIEPELMAKCADVILLNANELGAWVGAVATIDRATVPADTPEVKG